MTDEQARDLLGMIHTYVTEYESCADMTISQMAEDIVMSLDYDTVKDNIIKDAIKAAVTKV